VQLTVEVVGDDRYTLEVEGDTYADVLDRLDLSPQAVAVFVDGHPVPEDREVEAENARVVRLISGG
jgi:sulfur carrier protein